MGPEGQPAKPKQTSVPGQRRNPDAPKSGGLREYFRNVRGELRKVNWPSRRDVVNYASVVLASLVVVIALIFVLNTAFSKAVFFLFK
jgi:preprotein translocase subunit SecE